MLDSLILDNYNKLKNEMAAAYSVFRRNPSVTNASAYTTATQAYTTFCVETMKALAGDVDEPDKQSEILANIEKYRTCKECGSEILYKVDDKHILESSDFEPNFPGWCHTCLVEHCVATDCSACTIVADHTNCSFKETKNFYMNQEV